MSSPDTMRRWTHWWLGLNRRVWQTIAVTPVRRWAATTASVSASESAIGISIRTCLPASMAATAWAAWTGVGLARMAASTPGSSSISDRSRPWRGISNSAAKLAVPPGSPPATPTTSTSSMRRSAAMCWRAMAPSPATTTPMR